MGLAKLLEPSEAELDQTVLASHYDPGNLARFLQIHQTQKILSLVV
ncbi:hypothetical protein KZZ20_07950 [Methylacidiphilum fumariolicum]|uniref:Uncharacterized protein n=2 Tax=Candidatus Methylacidiphilum fumarolicum TaxID=591154 RepID=I0JZJ1_METFB|nr:hypothetical protein [Candidatus Methylacidiphilum fumarolicum]MBW6415441.1 hypothetical protein [Candidatus Methylacidiphilum fumarolicum]CAI9085211.1 conserved protein of unknown function [Candidatus Methylacidiphilum fumarolicum]CCG92660.1 hypothetical protein MFUM_720026 [Methylacidiphilum fumariolicum SolV]